MSLRTRLREQLKWRLARGWVGEIARDAVALHPCVHGDTRLFDVADTAEVNDVFVNLASGRVTIGPQAFLGHGVSLITGTHDVRELGEARRRAIPSSGRDILIEEGAWVASNVTVLGPARIGRHAVVAAGAVVTGDVAPFTVVGGVPAREISRVPEPAAS
jgi:acetyltransferase-like isoleucine patch superfamily enzyme